MSVQATNQQTEATDVILGVIWCACHLIWKKSESSEIQITQTTLRYESVWT